jgi:hypothetical protein
MTFGFRLFTFAGLCLTWSLNAAWAAGSCHIHPLGTDMKDAELRATEWYGSLEECEIANKNFMADWACVIVFRMEFSMEEAMTGGLG